MTPSTPPTTDRSLALQEATSNRLGSIISILTNLKWILIAILLVNFTSCVGSCVTAHNSEVLTKNTRQMKVY